MFLTKYSPMATVDNFWEALGRDFFPLCGADDEGFRLPSTNINEKETEFVISMEMPGVSRKDVEVSVEGGSLTVAAEKVNKVESEGLLRNEIRTDKFRRSFQIGSNIDGSKIKAKMEDGILKLILPKKPENVGRKIDIS